MANSETKMKNFVGLSRQYYWVPDAQKSAASSSNSLGPFLDSGSLSSGWVDPLIFDLEASYIPLVPHGANNPCHGLLAKKSKKKVWINQKQSRYNVPIFYVNGDKKP